MDLNKKPYPLLETIETPEQLHALDAKQLRQLSDELRGFLIESLNICGGHFAANLGTVELTVALHHVFHSPEDDLIWDVGHQAYPHKILTGRRAQLTSIRQQSGLSPFPTRNESEFDSFGVGHSSTSISAGVGMAMANRLQNTAGHVVAIIGDGAMTAGMAFEALNHAGDLKANLLVILNDNDMSISNNVGALSNYLARILSSKLYATVRASSKKMLNQVPTVRALAKRTEEHVKGLLTPGMLFEELGFNYIGPIDGHDLLLLVDTLKNLRKLPGPQLLHIATKKGKGFAAAEKDPISYHAVSRGFLKPAASTRAAKPLNYANVFGRWICAMAARDSRLVAITPAMREGSDLIEFSKHYPDRYYDVGIAEQHAVTFAAGLACKGLKPIVAIYSTFLQRAYDQLIHDVALQNLPVLFAIDRAGLVGGDGATHQGCFDLSYLRCIPNLVIMTPSDENELYQMLYTGFICSGPCAVRYPRGQGPGHPINLQMITYPFGKAVVKRTGKRVAFLAFGPLLTQALEAASSLDATVVDMRFVKPLDIDLIKELAATHDLLVTLEENVIQGGAGQAVSAVCHAQQFHCAVLCLGFPDQFIEHGDPAQLLSELGLNSPALIQQVTQRLAKLSTF